MAPRRTKMDSRIKPPHARGEPEDDTISPTYPWPREEGTEISLTDPYIPASSEERWDKEPRVLGIADLCHITHPLYPDLVRQVLATAELTFKRSGFPIFKEASFTFYASGVKLSISLEKLTEIYEISEEYTKTSFPRKFPPEQAFWKFIASGDFKSRSASTLRPIHFQLGLALASLFRNLVLRIAAKVLRNLLFSKDKTSKVTRGELQMLFAGVKDEIKSADIGIPTSEMKTSPGCVVVQMFVDKKARVIKGSLKKDCSGSLLTPLFRHLELDLSPYQCNETMQFVDAPYLINCQILRDEATYSFIAKDFDFQFTSFARKIVSESYGLGGLMLGSEMVISKSTAMIISYSRISHKTFTERKIGSERTSESCTKATLWRAEPTCGYTRPASSTITPVSSPAS
ncbi:hypothetical protein F2Q70_00029553 [Brassica cretica]|uniref:Arabidopsis retrotransposon Orf1 C-terminal domain-containing protein n=1 Tax=Brassica cretica TaxID=69181 RepID=A0A8S9FH73_BRACR|nr:hypothetical protein F2Q70_00029553 [Brassica cretica]